MPPPPQDTHVKINFRANHGMPIFTFSITGHKIAKSKSKKMTFFSQKSAGKVSQSLFLTRFQCLKTSKNNNKTKKTILAKIATRVLIINKKLKIRASGAGERTILCVFIRAFFVLPDRQYTPSKIKKTPLN